VAIASCVGTTIEFYDFFIYGTAAALVFPKAFFPALGSTAGTVASFATFAVAFIARPVGAVAFGHYGDRIGRKRTLISTLLLMGVSTVLIGLLPGAATIGVAAPILLVVLRFAQGLAVGREWAGATLLTAEYAPPGQRGRYAMFPQLGPAIAIALASATFLVTSLTLGNTDQSFLDYGWRIPFLISIALIVTLGLQGIGYGPMGAFLPETFPTRYRYTGAGMSYNLAAIVGGGITPLVSAPLTAAFGSFTIGVLLCGLALLSLCCTASLAETKDHDLRQVQPSVPALP
jgi:MFS family permease